MTKGWLRGKFCPLNIVGKLYMKRKILLWYSKEFTNFSKGFTLNLPLIILWLFTMYGHKCKVTCLKSHPTLCLHKNIILLTELDCALQVWSYYASRKNLTQLFFYLKQFMHVIKTLAVGSRKKVSFRYFPLLMNITLKFTETSHILVKTH